MTEYLTTRVQGKRTECDRTFFLLETADGKVKGINYDFPLNLPTITLGDRVDFHGKDVTITEPGHRITHDRYHTVALFKAGEATAVLEMSGRKLALYERANQDDSAAQVDNDEESGFYVI